VKKRRGSLTFAALSLAGVLMLGGCVKLGPDFVGVGKAPIPAKWRHSGKGRDLARWWRIFHDPMLNRLVKKAYSQNLDIESAGLRIVQARAALGISEGFAFPQKQAISGNAVSSQIGTGSHAQSIASAALNFDLGWEMDLWGKYARGIEASRANLYAAVASYDSIVVSVIAEVARNYIDYRTAEERIAYAKRNILIQEYVARMTEIQFNSGNVSELDMQQARTQLYTTRSILPSIELGMVRSRNAMAVLLGINPSEVDRFLKKKRTVQGDTITAFLAAKNKGVLQIKEKKKDIFDLSYVPVAHFDPYARIDAELIARRPDIKVAEYRVHAASAGIGQAMAELYPSFVLFGNIGYTPNNASGSWKPPSQALGVSIGPSFSWNIFQYGRIKNQIRLQDALFEERLVDYNKAVLSAVSEVDNALQGYLLNKRQLKENGLAVDATVRAFNISAVQYNDGLVSYQRLLSTVENLTRSQDAYAQIKGGLALQAVALYKALGGGWQISRGKAYLSRETAARMKRTVDWGRYLDPSMTRLPKTFEAKR